MTESSLIHLFHWAATAVLCSWACSDSVVLHRQLGGTLSVNIPNDSFCFWQDLWFCNGLRRCNLRLKYLSKWCLCVPCGEGSESHPTCLWSKFSNWCAGRNAMRRRGVIFQKPTQDKPKCKGSSPLHEMSTLFGGPLMECISWHIQKYWMECKLVATQK